jgi:tryptophan 2,3-dioxygenase
MLRPHSHRPEVTALLQAELDRPALYDVAIDLLAKTFDIPQEVTTRDRSRRHDESEAVKRAWMEVYQDPARYWELYELAEKLVDLEDYFRRWRFNHVTTVERVIGFKRGTGGTGGVSYLKKMLEVELFPELWHMRTDL